MAKAAAVSRSIPKPTRTPAETRHILSTLGAQHPNADTELNFTNAYELLVATILSAQCTDERVNQVTPALFRRYPDPRSLARAATDELEPQIQSTGFFRAKSRSLVGMASAVVERYGGQIPNTLDELVTLPGVGRKTANVVLGHALGVPGLPVDRHVLRVANRIGIARSEDPEIVEQQLCAAMPSDQWTRTSDTLILHGRRICRPRPLCDRCAVRDVCAFFRSAKGAALVPARRVQRASGEPPRARAKSKALVRVRRAAKPRDTGRGSATETARPESGSVPGVRRAAKPRETGRGSATETARSESGSMPGVRRAAKPRETGRGSATETARSESGSMPGVPRAAKPRDTGRGGGAPRQTK